MQNYKTPEVPRKEEMRRDQAVPGERVQRVDTVFPSQQSLSTRQMLEMHLREKSRREVSRKWTGRGLIVFGALLLIGSCPFYALSLAGPATIIAAVVLIAGGSALLSWRPRLRAANEAVLIAMKYGNRLTAAKLALELDVSFEKAERIIQELVRSGTAEIDLDQRDPDHTIVYRIKGL
jgi:hypothetical protein